VGDRTAPRRVAPRRSPCGRFSYGVGRRGASSRFTPRASSAIEIRARRATVPPAPASTICAACRDAPARIRGEKSALDIAAGRRHCRGQWRAFAWAPRPPPTTPPTEGLSPRPSPRGPGTGRHAEVFSRSRCWNARGLRIVTRKLAPSRGRAGRRRRRRRHLPSSSRSARARGLSPGPPPRINHAQEARPDHPHPRASTSTPIPLPPPPTASTSSPSPSTTTQTAPTVLHIPKRV